ncbi:hypothetical protein [Ralstonia pseudosolanacearum]|uniref:Uncharacterized protein n=1 Tax=Ralstonia solanacearum TaxID=305 RepID=A0A0S4X0I9_RALSL|nr:hypothetical protein [Ralstonia sp. RS650]UZF14021.1 hypothetical protein LH706_13405 [Ralstonia solanacearum]UZF29151.1 hypothetical protein LGV82_13410 [Ralstonia sp. RS650]CUV57016.1 protein of unknown function [Ralstonia solanacearum]
MMNHSTPTADLFIAHLGRSYEDLDKSVWQYARNPDFDLPEHSPIGGVFFERYGFSITICPPDFYHGDDSLKFSPAVITNVQLYSGDEYYNHERYPGALPHGLDFDDNRDTLLRKLGPSAWTFPFVPSLTLERWDFDNHWIVVVYAKQMASIRMMQVGLKRNPPRPSVLPKVLEPDIHTLQSLFRREWPDVASQPSMHGIDFSPLKEAASHDDSSIRLDELPTRGVELYFHPSQEESTHGKRILSGARYFRRGVHSSVGFDGAMPCGLTFSTPLEDLVSKVGSYPLAGQADSLTGHYAWKLPDFLLHVSFSVMEQWITRIRIAVPPYYVASYLEKPRLRVPGAASQSDAG